MQSTDKNTPPESGIPVIARLWILRLLVQMGLQHKLILANELASFGARRSHRTLQARDAEKT